MSRLPAAAYSRLTAVARMTGVHDLVEPAHSAVRRELWRRAGRPVPPPSAVKRATLRAYARRYGLRVLVETGTFRADTVRALRKDFDRIYSIEIDERLFRAASRRCRGQANARLLHGDSSVLLPAVVEELTEPALFWLDAHFSGAGTGTADLETPILAELSAVLRGPVARHVVLIDDYREFVGSQVDYPAVGAIRELASAVGYQVHSTDDILRLVPDRASQPL